jgi:thiamine-phosphate pyrophosphorylase
MESLVSLERCRPLFVAARSPMPTLAEVARHLKPRHPVDALPGLILMTDSVRLPDPGIAIQHLASGSAIVVREQSRERRAALARRIKPLCRYRSIRLLIANDWRLARSIAADGLHLSEASIRRGSRRWTRVRRPEWIVTAAAHSPAAVRRAAKLGVDAVLLSPVFATKSHPGAGTIGPLRFARWVEKSPIPVYALGGIDAKGARRLRNSGAAGFAAIGGLVPSGQPGSASHE